MKEIASNKKYILSLVDPDEVFDILGKDDGVGLFCRVIKGSYQKTTHELRHLKVVDIKNYIEAAKNNDPNEFIIFYRVAENEGGRKFKVRIYDENVDLAEKYILEADRACSSGPCAFQDCPLHGYGHCWEIIAKYKKGELEEANE